MRFVSLGIQVTFLFWLIWSIFATSVDGVQKGYVYADYSILVFIVFWLFYNIFNLKVRKVTIGLGLFLLACVMANLHLGIPIIATHFKYVVYFFILSLINTNYDYSKLWNFRWLLYPILLIYLFGWNKPTRPFIFYENNFELLTLIIVFAPGIILNYPKKTQVAMLLGLIVLRSGSLSAFTAFSALVVFSLNMRWRLIFLSAAIPTIGLLISQKGATIMDIDRVIFSKIALETFTEFSYYKQLVSFYVYPVANRWNDYLNFYALDFNGINFPVSLHSFHLRLLLINGILGSLGVLFLLYKTANINLKVRRGIFLVLVIAGFSISSFNNLFVFVGMYMVIRYSSYSRNISSREELGLQTYSYPTD